MYTDEKFNVQHFQEREKSLKSEGRRRHAEIKIFRYHSDVFGPTRSSWISILTGQ